VFDPAEAVAREDLEFFAFGHELVDRLIALAISEDAVTGVVSEPALPAGTYVEVFWELESVGVRPSGRFVRHLVDERGTVQSLEVTKALPVTEGASLAEIPPWTSSAVEASRARISAELKDESLRVREEHEVLRAERLVRAERVSEQGRHRLQQMVDRDLEKIERLERFGSDKEKRILAALRGKVAKNEERIERIEADYTVAAQEIESKSASVTARMVAAGLVVGG
jgi:RNA polymerase recycling family C-terminal